MLPERKRRKKGREKSKRGVSRRREEEGRMTG
jgi:hypothetical protein